VTLVRRCKAAKTRKAEGGEWGRNGRGRRRRGHQASRGRPRCASERATAVRGQREIDEGWLGGAGGIGISIGIGRVEEPASGACLGKGGVAWHVACVAGVACVACGMCNCGCEAARGDETRRR
jgi:hypothetical protein